MAVESARHLSYRHGADRMSEFPPQQINWWLLLPTFVFIVAASIAFLRGGWPAIWEFTFAIVTGVFLAIIVISLTSSGAVSFKSGTFALLLLAWPSSVFLHLRAVHRESRYDKRVIVAAIGGWATFLIIAITLTVASSTTA